MFKIAIWHHNHEAHCSITFYKVSYYAYEYRQCAKEAISTRTLNKSEQPEAALPK